MVETFNYRKKVEKDVHNQKKALGNASFLLKKSYQVDEEKWATELFQQSINCFNIESRIYKCSFEKFNKISKWNIWYKIIKIDFSIKWPSQTILVLTQWTIVEIFNEWSKIRELDPDMFFCFERRRVEQIQLHKLQINHMSFKNALFKMLSRRCHRKLIVFVSNPSEHLVFQ